VKGSDQPLYQFTGWYISHGNDERAKEILVEYHGEGNPDSEVVRMQMKEMKEVIELESGTDKRYVLLLISVGFVY
jgi:hypothetical protein